MKRKSKKVVSLYETRISRGYLAMTLIFYLLAAFLWYLVCVIGSYTYYVPVSEEDNGQLTREAFSASDGERAADERDKERVLFMPTGEASFYRRIRLVESAKKRIDFLVYENFNDEGTTYFYTALLRAADRGVKVRIMIDGKMGRIKGHEPLARLLQNHNNIEFYTFNDFNLSSPSGLMVACHDKILLVDDDKMIVGGANMGYGGYLGNYDTEVMITNTSRAKTLGAARTYYDAMLASGLAKRRTSKKSDFDKKREYEAEILRYLDGFRLGEEIDYGRQGVAADKITYLTNVISDGKKPPIIMQAIFNLARSSKSSTFVTPYVLYVKGKKAELVSMAKGSERFRIITNSLYNTKNFAYSQYYYSRRELLDDKLELYEYQADRQLHSKMYLFDDRFTVIGSFNSDERSAHIDTESVVIVDSPAFNKIVNDYVDETFAGNSLRVGTDNKYIPSETVKEGRVPLGKCIRFFLQGVVDCIINLL